MSPLVRSRRSPLWLALYALGLVCVFSFVLFEVLDVDGSDFERAPSRLAIKLGEESHDELKRPALGPGGPWLVPSLDARAAELPPTSSTAERHGLPSVPPPVRTSRAALPRALLSDVPPSA
jgi:hypothetical protein